MPSITRAEFLPLEKETRPRVDTNTAAYHLCRSPKTLRNWADADSGPLRPLRINGRLAWAVADIRALLQTEVAE